MNKEKQTQAAFRRRVNGPFFWAFLLARLPAAFFMGIRVKKLEGTHCSTSLPFFWLSQNPFRSIYFAALAAAAEMSTGLLCMQAIHGQGSISMLVTGMEAEFSKKALQRTTFTCTDGDKLDRVIQKVRETGEGQQVVLESRGVQKSGEEVARFRFTWSFKVRNP